MNILLYAVLGYLLVINVITFVVFGLDKASAAANGKGGRNQRVPEKKLWAMALLGGSAGALAGMKLFRHKTKKASFQLMMLLIIVVQVAAVIGLAMLTGVDTTSINQSDIESLIDIVNTVL